MRLFPPLLLLLLYWLLLYWLLHSVEGGCIHIQGYIQLLRAGQKPSPYAPPPGGRRPLCSSLNEKPMLHLSQLHQSRPSLIHLLLPLLLLMSSLLLLLLLQLAHQPLALDKLGKLKPLQTTTTTTMLEHSEQKKTLACYYPPGWAG